MRLHSILTLARLAAAATATSPVVDLGYVKYAGYADPATGLNSWKGIRYAQPPTGNRRFRAPQPIDEPPVYSSGEPIDALRTPSECWQSAPIALVLTGEAGGLDPSNVQGSEDCLFLTVLAPQKPVSAKLPVAVWIHGGGYTQGSSDLYPGDAMTHASNGHMIFVSIQYRLGLFGFLPGKRVAQDGILNAGIRDQRLALEWIAKYVARFGGDPDMITIWGGSAGGGSVALHMTSFGGQGTVPFSGAIAEYPWDTPILTPELQEVQYQSALREAGCADLACLRALDTGTLAFANQAVLNNSYPSAGYGFGTFYWGPVIDGDYVQELPSLGFQGGRFHRVPLMTNRETYEGWIFSNMSQTSVQEETEDARYTFPAADDAFYQELYRLYPRDEFNSTFVQRQTWFGDMIINCPSRVFSESAVSFNANSSAVFKMIFNANSGLHGHTQPFLFGSGSGFSGTTDQTLAQIMSSYWISFVRFHDPNPARVNGAAFWPSYGGSGSVIQVDPDNAVFVEQDPDMGERCSFWASQNQVVMN